MIATSALGGERIAIEVTIPKVDISLGIAGDC